MPVTTYVLVHGAFANAAHWGPVARGLAGRGHRALAVDLPGHGLDARATGMAELGTADDVACVVDTVRAAAAHGPVVLVGHSRGGLAVTAAANAVPELVAHVAFVSAWCCVVGGPSAYAGSAEAAGSELDALVPSLLVADPREVGELRVDFSGDDPGLRDALQSALLADGTRDELAAVLAAFDRVEAPVVDEELVRLDPDRGGRLPRTYVRLPDDRALPVALQDRFVAEADASTPGNPFRVVSLGASHVGVQVHPEPLVAVLDEVAVSAGR